MISIFGYQNMGHRCLGRDAALDEPGGRGRLHHHLLAGPAGVFWPARHGSGASPKAIAAVIGALKGGS